MRPLDLGKGCSQQVGALCLKQGSIFHLGKVCSGCSKSAWGEHVCAHSCHVAVIFCRSASCPLANACTPGSWSFLRLSNAGGGKRESAPASCPLPLPLLVQSPRSPASQVPHSPSCLGHSPSVIHSLPSLLSPSFLSSLLPLLSFLLTPFFCPLSSLLPSSAYPFLHLFFSFLPFFLPFLPSSFLFPPSYFLFFPPSSLPSSSLPSLGAGGCSLLSSRSVASWFST